MFALDLHLPLDFLLVQPKSQDKWLILHAASKESLIHHCTDLIGSGRILLGTRGGAAELDHLCGNVAAHLCTQGFTIVDGFPSADPLGAHMLAELMRRTSSAQAPQILLLPDPIQIRSAALVDRCHTEMGRATPSCSSRSRCT